MHDTFANCKYVLNFSIIIVTKNSFRTNIHGDFRGVSSHLYSQVRQFWKFKFPTLTALFHYFFSARDIFLRAVLRDGAAGRLTFFCTDFVKISSKYNFNKTYFYVYFFIFLVRAGSGGWCICWILMSTFTHSRPRVCGTKTKYHRHSIFLKKRKFGVKHIHSCLWSWKYRIWRVYPGSSTSSGCPCQPARVPRSPSAHSLSAVSCIGTRNAAWLLFWPDFKIITFVRRSSVKSGIIHTQCKQAPLFQIWSREVYIYQLG